MGISIRVLKCRYAFHLSILIFATCVSASAMAADDAGIAQMKQRAFQFLQVTQNEDGSWTRSDAIGISALVTSALLESGKTPDDPMVAKSLAYLVASQQANGGIFAAGSRHENYETCIALMALADANQDGRYSQNIKKAETFLRGLQWDEGEGIESSDGAYGGGGYDSKQRPDMSNTQFLI